LIATRKVSANGNVLVDDRDVIALMNFVGDAVKRHSTNIIDC
jgi:hypothetical protein